MAAPRPFFLWTCCCFCWFVSYGYAREFVFNVGAALEDGVSLCSGMADAHLGYNFAVDKLNGNAGDHGRGGLATDLFITDAQGNQHRILFNYTRLTHNCTRPNHQAKFLELVNQTHFIFGSSPIFADTEAAIAAETEKLLYHCCVTPDALYEQNMPYMFGIPASNTKYTLQAVKSMALTGGVRRLFIFYLEGITFTETTCQATIDYVNNVLIQLEPDFQIVGVVKYTPQEQAGNSDDFIRDAVVGEAMRLGADAIIGCDGERNGFRAARVIANANYYLKALFLTVAPSRQDFITQLGARATENVLTATQWHPSMTYADSFFGTSAAYTDSFRAAHGVEPSYLAALASATVYSLAVAVQGAFTRCTFRDLALGTDALLFDVSAIECEDPLGRPYTGNGYDLIRDSLEDQSLETVVGSVAFNRFRRNVAKQPAVTQIQSGVIECVLPLEFANRGIIMPIPPPLEDEPSSKKYIGQLPRTAFIIVVVVVVGSVLLLVVSFMVLWWWWRRKQVNYLRSQLVRPDQLDIVTHPQQLADGSWECGKAKFCSSLVALEPLVEMMLASTAGDRTKHDLRIKDMQQGTALDAGLQERTARVGIEIVCQDPLVHLDAHRSASFTNELSMHALNDAHSKHHHNARLPRLGPVLSPHQMLALVSDYRRLQHPSIVPVAGLLWSLPSMPPGLAMLVTECQELGTLSSVLENDLMELDIVKLLDIAKDLAQALAYLHAQEEPKLNSVLPNKLAGVMLNKHCRAKLRVPLTSFRQNKPGQRGRLLPWVFAPTQTPEPSQCTKQAAEDTVASAEELADVLQFGLGIIEMLATPASSMSTSSRVTQSTTDEWCVSPPSVSAQEQLLRLEHAHAPALVKLLRQCCAHDPQQRPRFTQVYDELELHTLDIVHAAQHSQDHASPFSNHHANPSADELLYDLFPVKVANALKSGRTPDPELYPCVSLFFSDVVGYTDLCSKLSPQQVMAMLHRLYSRFDAIAQSLDLFKVETIGDSWMGVSNLRTPQPNSHTALMAAFAFKCLEAANAEPVCLDQPELGCIHIRVGVHAGAVMGAVVGTLNRRFCLFGDAVNVASRMESTSTRDTVQCSAAFMDLLQEQWPEAADAAECQGERQIKGKGTMRTFFLRPP